MIKVMTFLLILLLTVVTIGITILIACASISRINELHFDMKLNRQILARREAEKGDDKENDSEESEVNP